MKKRTNRIIVVLLLIFVAMIVSVIKLSFGDEIEVENEQSQNKKDEFKEDAPKNDNVIIKNIKTETLDKMAQKGWICLKEKVQIKNRINKTGVCKKYSIPSQRRGKYLNITISDGELELLAKIVYLEARGESFEGQQAVVEVVFNRVLDSRFPSTVEEVLMDRKYGVQFATSLYLDEAFPTETQYEAIESAMESEGIVGDAIYFATSPLTENVVRQIGAHYFCT